MEALEVLQPGAFTTVQDLGRYGYQKYGVSISGAMDRFALRVANLLAGNEEREAALEATVVGPKLRALRNLRVAFSGADLSAQVNGKPAPMWSALEIGKGEVISFGYPKSGCRTYLALHGGIDFPVVMGSRSVHTRSKLGGEGRALIKGDVLGVKEPERSMAEERTFPVLPVDQVPVYGKAWEVRVVFGPQGDYFTGKGIETFLNSEYTITPQSDRMGYRLKGPKIEHRAGPDILTDATPPGSIQVPGDGMPIVLLADGQTTGGYSKIAVVTSVDQDLLAQAKPGDKVRFRRVTVVEAHRLLGEMENKIREIKNRLHSQLRTQVQ
jgi:antagonist of KipI